MKKLVLFLACGLFITNMAFAQTKFGHINSQELLNVMPEMTKANTDLDAYTKTFQDQLQSMSAEYEKKVKEYQAGDKTMTDAVREVKEKEIRDLQARIESTNQSAQDKVQTKRKELLQPILDKAEKAIKDVAKEKGYDYVFDTSTGAVLVTKDADNLLPLVKTKLGIK
ncbi:MAG: hypothetical protein BGO70_18045 [Bacteroidetes bacterium 43-93]|nr:OmpH family outer membrane protein [Bacteroidota bacterium]MBS1780481.1 OmpH family outer membrane protein [Bacteroidota bacterium]OJX01639.1 MAG: hypothetical protein BGO70_18045 [Bacteroidetes bacterium 43-93]